MEGYGRPREPNEDEEAGVIINVYSIAGLDGADHRIAYVACKAAVAGMTLSAARNLAGFGIRVVCVAPRPGIPESARARFVFALVLVDLRASSATSCRSPARRSLQVFIQTRSSVSPDRLICTETLGALLSSTGNSGDCTVQSAQRTM